jgi:hypothetical protein
METPRQTSRGTEVFTFSAPPELAAKIRQYKEANPRGFSQFVSSCIETRIGTVGREVLHARLDEAEEEIEAAERELLRRKARKREIDAQLREIDLDRDRIVDRRLKLLERARSSGWIQNPAACEGWATGPAGIEALTSCGFESHHDALEWLQANAQLLER